MSKYNQSTSLPTNFEGFMNARRPQDCFTFFDDFLGASWSQTDNAAKWFGTVVAGLSTAVADDGVAETPDEAGGMLKINCIGTADDGYNLQAPGTGFIIDQDCGLPLAFEARFQVENFGNTDIFIGLSHADVEIVKTGLNDGVGFLVEEGKLYAHAAKNSTEKSVDCSVTDTDNVWWRVRFFFDGADTITFEVDDNDDGEFDYKTTLNVSTAAHYIPDDEFLTPTIEAITGATAEAEVLMVDYVICTQQRYHA